MAGLAARTLALTSTIALTACAAGLGGPPPSSTTAAQAGQAAPITSAERQQGNELHPQILQEFGGTYDGSQASYATSVGQKIALQSGLGSSQSAFTVTLLNSPVNNAFAIPGGYVYVTRQLMALMNDEAELAGVLGHEVGHVAARHSQKRQEAAQRNSIIGLLGQIGSALLLGDSELGRLGQQAFGTGSQLLTLSYSRSQEYQADDLGVAYLRSAGYDPNALASMLASLAAQSSIDARASGGDAGRSAPSWASTHPDPASRVQRAANLAGPNATGIRNRDVFLTRVDGILYGDDPEQGVINGQQFIHPGLRLAFQAPSGFGMQNGTTAVSISGQNGKAQFSTRAYNGNLESYVRSVFSDLAGDNSNVVAGTVQRTTVNGLPAAYSVTQVNNGQQVVDVTVFAYEFSNNQAFHFVALSSQGQANQFTPMYNSLRRISASEAAEVRPRKIDVVTVRSGDTSSGLASRMAYDDLKLERFLALNGLSSNSPLQAGQKVKIVTY